MCINSISVCFRGSHVMDDYTMTSKRFEKFTPLERAIIHLGLTRVNCATNAEQEEARKKLLDEVL